LAEAVRSGRAGADMSVAYERRARHAGLKYALVVLVGALVTSLVAAGLRAASDRWLPAVWNPVVVYAGRNPIAWVFIILAVVAFAAVFIWWRRRRQ
jgi:hypothetical protein